MSHISFRVVSIELKDSTVKELNPSNLFRLNLTQRPHHIRQDYIVNNEQQLRNVNHEWSIDNSQNQVERVTLTLRTIQKKDANSNIDQNTNENANNSINNDDYIEPKRSLIGYCTVDIKDLRKGTDNDFTVQLLTRVNVKIVGYVHLQVVVWENDQKLLKKEKTQKNKKKNVSRQGYRNYKEYSSLI